MLGLVAVPAVVAVLGLASAVVVTALQERSDGARRAQLVTEDMRYALQSLGNAPFEASPAAGGSPSFARGLIQQDQTALARSLQRLKSDSSPPRDLAEVDRAMAAMQPVTARIFWIGAHDGGYNGPEGGKVPALQARQETLLNRIDARLGAAGSAYARRAAAARSEAIVGSLGTIGLLIFAFAVIYGRAARARRTAVALVAENDRLLDMSRHEALTDALTGLPNRRALIADLDDELSRFDPHAGWALAVFDLDGFKEYNDTFGHPAGDALLARLGDRLTRSTAGAGRAYRMGGDEFCVLCPGDSEAGEALIARAADALKEHGQAFAIGCSYGLVHLPDEAATATEALRVADDRMYEYKGTRASARRQSTDVLLAALSERSHALNEHLGHVATLAAATARALGLEDPEIRRIVSAAELHDVGKLAIPESILDRPGPLDEQEWQFVRQHTLIGERIMSAAPSLLPAAALVRASHERYDGTGYPDGLAADSIPLGAHIIAVCDAYDAMTTSRPYNTKLSHGSALAELRRCAGGQFHPAVVSAFCALDHPGLHLSSSPTAMVTRVAAGAQDGRS